MIPEPGQDMIGWYSALQKNTNKGINGDRESVDYVSQVYYKTEEEDIFSYQIISRRESHQLRAKFNGMEGKDAWIWDRKRVRDTSITGRKKGQGGI